MPTLLIFQIFRPCVPGRPLCGPGVPVAAGERPLVLHWSLRRPRPQVPREPAVRVRLEAEGGPGHGLDRQQPPREGLPPALSRGPVPHRYTREVNYT